MIMYIYFAVDWLSVHCRFMGFVWFSKSNVYVGFFEFKMISDMLSQYLHQFDCTIKWSETKENNPDGFDPDSYPVVSCPL